MSNAGQCPIEFMHLNVPARLTQLPVVRRRLRRCLATLPITPDREAEAVLAVDEAAVNAVQHAYPPDRPGRIDITMWTEWDAVCVQIVDHGRWREPPRGPQRAGHGLGITLMHRLGGGVVIHHGRHGTTVLLRYPLTDPGGRHGSSF